MIRKFGPIPRIGGFRSTVERHCISLSLLYFTGSNTMTQAYSKKKEIREIFVTFRLLTITSSDALPLGSMRLVGAKAFSVGRWDKHPATARI